MRHLLLFTIGPVQSFISQARKTHDLYAGSKLLSDLIKTAIDKVGEDNLIFPKKGESMPNRFLAFVPDNVTDFKNFGQEVENFVRGKWVKIANDTFENTPFRNKPLGFDEQIQEFLEVFWIIKPLDDDNGYVRVYSEIEKELAAIKNARPFSQFTWQKDTIGEVGRKCNLDGQQNVQFFRKEKGKNVSITRSPLYSVENGAIISDNFKDYELEVGEGLSAISFVKRKYAYDEKVPFKSTAEIALLDVINNLDRKEKIKGYALIRNYQKLFSSFNPQLYYEDNLNEDFLRKQGISIKGKGIEFLTKKLRELKRCADFNFNKYYAILLFDGDNMGKWWSGANLSDSNRLFEFQQKLSSLLSKFAGKAKNILNKNGGQAVYAGGDDFMGFVNLNHLWEVLKQLRSLFKTEVSDKIKDFTDKELSFSAGICVAQYKEPLSLVLDEARQAESRAKDFDDGKKKNAFSISVIKSSGESHQATLSFGTDFKNIDRISDVIDALANGAYSNSFINNIEREFSQLIDLDKPVFEVESMFREELKRLLSHSKMPGESASDVQKEKIFEELMELVGSGSLRNFFHLLSIIDFFKRTIDKPNYYLTLEA